MVRNSWVITIRAIGRIRRTLVTAGRLRRWIANRGTKIQLPDEKPPIPMLARRRIEAEILKHVHDMLKKTHGVDVAGKIIADAVRKSSMPQAAEFATKSWRQHLDADVRRSSGPLDRRRRVGNRTSRSRPRRATSSASRAGRYAEMYREMGLGEIGHLLSCQRGATFCEGYDKRLKLRRTQTIMQGASHCDFDYRLVDEP